MIDLKICRALFVKHTEKTLGEIDEAAAHDHLMNADEAIAFGICDDIGSLY